MDLMLYFSKKDDVINYNQVVQAAAQIRNKEAREIPSDQEVVGLKQTYNQR